MNRRSRRLVLAAMTSLALLVFGVGAVFAQDATPEAGAEDCIGCHEGLRGHWDDSAHANAFADRDFQTAWQEQGSPQECLQCHTTGYDAATGTYQETGVACLACHYPVPSNHPDTYMPTDVSSRLCGTCHTDTFAEWEVSEHGTQGMTCNTCHSPHTSSIKGGNSNELCQSCHDTQGHYYSFTGHASEGLLCTDCHLRVAGPAEEGEMGHGQRHHTFQVDLETCNGCHVEAMHASPEEVAMVQATITPPPPPEPATEVVLVPTPVVATAVLATQTAAAPVSEEPHGPSPFLYILPAGIGLVFGMLIAPSAERFMRRNREEN